MKTKPDMLIRSEYIEKLDTVRDRPEIAKIITGIRRCGKSTLMMQYMQHLRDSGIDENRIFYINLESEENNYITNHLVLQDLIKSSIKKDDRTYVFFDEIQRVEGWEKNINSLMVDYDADIYLTGSNAYMLSSDLSTYISGRYIEIKMLPFSFKEYIKFHNLSDKIESAFNDYIWYGSFPMIRPTDDENLIKDYLQGIYNTILVKDVLTHANLRNVGVLKDIAKYLFSNIGNITNLLTIAKDANVSVNTAKSYVAALEEAFIIQKAERYDVRGKKILKSNEKYYVTDTGIRNAALGPLSGDDESRQIENIVYLELIRRGYEVMVGSYRDFEVDFTAIKGNSVEYFQVTQTMLAEKTKEREMRSLNAINDNYPKTILSLDRILSRPRDGIIHRNLIDWLLDVN